ncbi:molybdopterin-dependent oxidoreductase [Alphaproteobacteria bacterium]|nr:molybdopterin-dependent oxidoreductase [Alphaproteobacteria bacterium]MDC1023196.1 molybdopterin-dependent oxidoreductase [Alphaproteobacteria bacterium]
MNAVNTGPSISSYKKLKLWFNFDNPNILQIYSGKVDIGQHISSTLALICSQITGVNYNQIEVIKLNTDISPDEGITASSMSVAVSGTAIKAASFALKKQFYNYAINTFNILEENILYENGIIKDKLSNKTTSYWDFSKTDEFQELEIPEILINNEVTKFNQKNTEPIEIKTIQDIVTGQYKYVQDMSFPNMLHARIVRPPNYHSKLIRVNKEFLKILKKNRIKIFIKGSFIALLSIEEFLVVKYLNLIKKQIIWTDVKDLANDNIFNSLSKNDKDTLLVKAGGIAYSEKIPKIREFKGLKIYSLSSEYKKNYLMHASIAPSAACAYFNENFTVFSHSQSLFALKNSLSKYFNIQQDRVILNHVPGSGCYGHNGADDVAFEAALLSKEFPKIHILLKWTREEENCWEPYGSASINKLKGVLDNEGKIVYWSNEAYSDTYLSRPSDSELSNFISFKFLTNDFTKKKSTPKTSSHMGIHRNLDPLYDFQETRLVKNLVHNLPLRTSALRTLGAFANVTAMESFINELALLKNIDPFEIRLNHLKDERAIDVLKNLRSHMKKKYQAFDFYRGIGFARYKNSAAYCAVGVELRVKDNLEVILNNAWITVDAGEIAFEDGIKAQVEGGFIQAASWTLYEEVRFDSKEIISKDWDSYKIIGFDNIPEFKTTIVDRKGFPYLGVGEVVAGPTGAAISNALHQALGQRIKTMPFTRENITKQLLN